MSRKLIVFGADGTLAKGITSYFLEQDFSKFYLVSRRYMETESTDKVKYIAADDLTKEDNVIKVFNEIEADEKSEFFLFSTIGGFKGGKKILEMDYLEWQKMFKLNLDISFFIAKHFSQLVKHSKAGSICFTSALSSLKPEPSNSAYVMSKNALNMLVKHLALEGKSYNLTANAVAPYVIDTKANREWVENDEIMVPPLKIAKTVLNLFNNYQYITGNIIELPGSLRID